MSVRDPSVLVPLAHRPTCLCPITNERLYIYYDTYNRRKPKALWVIEAEWKGRAATPVHTWRHRWPDDPDTSDSSDCDPETVPADDEVAQFQAMASVGGE
eukprot:9477627-Pyramimonas_sp.AAC.1